MADCQYKEADSRPNPGEEIRPTLKRTQVPALVRKLYGMDVLSVKELNGFYDQNFLIEISPKISNPYVTDISDHKFVFKITSSHESKNFSLIDAQNEMMLFLKSKGFKVQVPIKNIHASFISQEPTLPNIKDNIIRLFQFLPGQMMCEVSFTKSLLVEVGELVANVDNALESFQHDGLKNLKSVSVLSASPEFLKLIPAVKDRKMLEVVDEVMAAWNLNVVSIIRSLKSGAIHGDIHDYNLIVRSDIDHPDRFYIDGLIDFGDISESCYVFNVAISMAHMMMSTERISEIDVGGYILSGYLKHRSLSDDEWSILKECISMGLVLVLVLSLDALERDPNNEYTAQFAPQAWRTLKSFWPVSKQYLTARLKEIVDKCGAQTTC